MDGVATNEKKGVSLLLLLPPCTHACTAVHVHAKDGNKYEGHMEENRPRDTFTPCTAACLSHSLAHAYACMHARTHADKDINETEGEIMPMSMHSRDQVQRLPAGFVHHLDSNVNAHNTRTLACPYKNTYAPSISISLYFVP